MPLKRALAKLAEASSIKEVETCKSGIASTLSELSSKLTKDPRDLHSAVLQLMDFYASKHSEVVVDVVSSIPEAVAQEFLRLLADRILFAHKEFVTFSSGATMSISQASKYFDLLCSLLEFLLKIVSRGPWWNQLVISSMSAAFTDIIKDTSIDVSCYMAIVYILSICVPYSITYLDERLMLWLCHITNTLLCRVFGDGVKAVAHQLAEESLKASLMQLVLILYGIFPITFLKQLMQSCPSEVIDYVVSNLRLHPILSQHLVAQRGDFPTIPSPASNSALAGAGGIGGLSQAECKSKNRFRGKDFSDIVTECLNYEATSPPKLFSADAPSASATAGGNMIAEQTGVGIDAIRQVDSSKFHLNLPTPLSRLQRDAAIVAEDIDLKSWSQQSTTANNNGRHENINGLRFSCADFDVRLFFCRENTKRCPPDWCHCNTWPCRSAFDCHCFYSCPPSPSPLTELVKDSCEWPKPNDEKQLADHLPTAPPDTPLTTKRLVLHAQKSLSHLNESIRAMLSEHRQRFPSSDGGSDRRSTTTDSLVATKPWSFSATTTNSNEQRGSSSQFMESVFSGSGNGIQNDPLHLIPTQYVKCYVKLQQLKSEGLPESELLREQLRLTQLSLAYERHRQLIFICKNRSLMAEHKKAGEIGGSIDELNRRIRELEAKLETEKEKRVSAEQRAVHLLQTQSGLFVNVNQQFGGTDFLLADLSPRYRHKSGPSSIVLGSAPMLLDQSGISNDVAVMTQPSTPSAVMPRTSSASDFSSTRNEAAANTLAKASTVGPTSGSNERTNEELLAEIEQLRQQLKPNPTTSTQGNEKAVGGEVQQLHISSVEDAVRIENLTNQLNDSKREVTALGELMTEMKSRLDVAENDRRRLTAELTRLSVYGSTVNVVVAGGNAQPSPLPALTQHSLDTRLSSTSSTQSTRLEQYPTLKRQVEKILLRKQELATSVPTQSSNSSSSQQGTTTTTAVAAPSTALHS